MAPTLTEASFLSSLLSNEALAETSSTNLNYSNNSQTMALLEAKNSSPSLSNTDKNQLSDDTNLNIVADNALLPSTGPMSTSDGLDVDAGDASIYVVRKGDTVSQVATMFDVSVDTILAANDMKKGEKLKEGDILLILPISGLEHTVKKGDTLASIAKLYKTDPNDIMIYNDLKPETALVIGDKIMIPGADMADEGGDKPASNLGTVQIKDQNYYANHPIKNLAGYFINPVPTGHKTQGLHGPGHRGIDIGAPVGTPIYASASGSVLATKTGCKVGQGRCGGGYGNMVIIQHQNGTKTLYAHMTKTATSSGAEVKQGEIIGYVGSTGKSTGPHIHFEVFNAKNPGADWSWKQ